MGDLHVENFGTWRDAEGRLVWGVNDFDEVARMPYAVDLTRLVTSAILAKRENGLAIDPTDAATAVLEGYSEYLEEGGNPFILEESHPNLRAMALGAERDPTRFWSKLLELPQRVTAEGHSPIAQAVVTSWRPRHRILTPYRRSGESWSATICGDRLCGGGLAAREAKAWLPSAWGWAADRQKDHAYSNRLLKRSVRQLDPYYTLENGWVVRRIGPHCERIELAQFPQASRRTTYPEGYGA